jgi:AAA+ superfamily predicted ATPase
MTTQVQIDRLDVVTVTALVSYRQQLQEQVAEVNAALQAEIDRLAEKHGVEDAGHGYELFGVQDGTVYVRAREPESDE